MTLIQMLGTILGMEAIVIGITRYNSILSFIKNVWNFNVDFVETVMGYLSGKTSRWIFMKDNLGPLPITASKNEEFDENVTWVFNSYWRTLAYMDTDPDDIESIERRLPWLSANIYCNGTVHELDTIGNDFTFFAPDNVHPTPKLLLYCWSIINKRWFSSDDNVYIEVIDKDGDVYQYQVFNRSIANAEKWTDMFTRDLPDSESESESESVEDTVESETNEIIEENTEGTDGDIEDNIIEDEVST